MPTYFSRPGRIAAATAGALLTALVTAGCHDNNPPPNTVVTTTPPAPAVAALEQALPPVTEALTALQSGPDDG